MPKIKDLPKVDRPREKLLKKGVEALSDKELIMAILGRGIKGKSVDEIATDVLNVIKAHKNNMSFANLSKIHGMGNSKVSQILATFELAKRYLIKDNNKIQKTEDVLNLVANIRHAKQEHFIAITLTGASSVIEVRTVFKGTVNFSMVHPREIFADVLTDRAAGVIFVHNHPENDPQPSAADKKITQQLCDTAKMLGIQVIDHIIVTKDDYFSFQAQGLLNNE